MTATANVVHEATDLKQVGQRDQNEVTETRHAAQVEAARKHHQNPVAPVEALKKANAALARIADIATPDRKLVKRVQVEDDRVWIAVQDIVPLRLLSEALGVDAPILMLTHATVDQVIDDRALAHIVTITDHSSGHTAVTSVMVDPTLDTMLADMAVITPGSIHVMVRCIADSAHKAGITVRSSVHTAVTSVMAGLTLDIMPADMVVITPGSTHDTVRCSTDSAHMAVITVRSSAHTAVTSVTVDLTLDIMPEDMVVTIPGSTHDTVRCTTDSAHKAVITDQNLVRTASTSVTADPTLDIMPVATGIISAPILVHVMVARCPDIISVHEMATVAHISAHAICTPSVMLMRTCLVSINDPTSARDTTGPDVVALMGHHHLGNQVAKSDVTLVLNRIVALAMVAVQNHADPDALAVTRVRWLETLTATGDRNSDLHGARIEIALAWAPWGVAPAVITPKRARHVVMAEVVPNLDLKAMDLAEAECLVFHGDLGAVAPR